MKKLSAICFFTIAVSISAIAQERQVVPPLTPGDAQVPLGNK